MSNKGFTLVEMLLVLLLISICFTLSPVFHIPQQALMKAKMEQIRQTIVSIQAKALFEKREIRVHLANAALYMDDDVYPLPAVCRGDVLFHANGNVDHAMSIPCTYAKAQGTLVIQLGAGRIYAK